MFLTACEVMRTAVNGRVGPLNRGYAKLFPVWSVPKSQMERIVFFMSGLTGLVIGSFFIAIGWLRS